jgi:hypothetical protein
VWLSPISIIVFTIIIAVPVSRYAFSQPRILGSGSALVSIQKEGPFATILLGCTRV